MTWFGVTKWPNIRCFFYTEFWLFGSYFLKKTSNFADRRDIPAKMKKVELLKKVKDRQIMSIKYEYDLGVSLSHQNLKPISPAQLEAQLREPALHHSIIKLSLHRLSAWPTFNRVGLEPIVCFRRCNLVQSLRATDASCSAKLWSRLSWWSIETALYIALEIVSWIVFIIFPYRKPTSYRLDP